MVTLIYLGGPPLQCGLDAPKLKWLILPKMLQIAIDIYEDVTRRKACREQAPLPAPASKKAKGCLRQRDPW
jgi:hypothetical protein